jgi:NAD+ diphosphatase
MLGFTAAYVSGEAVASDGELEEARWFSRAELEEAAAGDGEMRLPPPIAIARTLIDAWLSRSRTDGAGTTPGPGGTRA